MRSDLVEILGSEGEIDRSLVVRSPKLIVAHVEDSSKEEEEMSLQRRGLRTLLAGRNKESAVKGALGSQPPTPPIPLTHVVNPFIVPPLKKKRKGKDVSEEGEVVP